MAGREQDVERALARAAVLQRIGLRAIPVVGGDEWTERAAHMAREYKVARTVDGQIDPTSWRQAQATLRENGDNRELAGR
ncbi:MAG: hypothetical protein DCC55_09105 [Chloroflexi bacterium]|nr:MAG: hypothetical protein DCC55_09105 [Chloroflexota bacterium]